MENSFYAVIMAGGGGTRLWPLSRKSSPKQLLKLVDGKSLFQLAVDRLHGIVNINQVYVVTIQEQVEMLHAQVPEIPMENYLIEPMPKGTAAVVGFAAAYLKKRDPEAVMAVLTADHVMENVDYFQKLLHNAAELARSNTLVTIGIKPEFPSTGFGYIEVNATNQSGISLPVKRFVEKPDQATAEGYIQSDSFYWNSGMFIWSVDAILAEIKRQMPDLFDQLLKVEDKIDAYGKVRDINSIWSQIEPQTIDYGIMEGAQDVTLIPALELGWKDLGSWDSLFTILKPDDWGNIVLAPHVLNIESQDCYIQTTDAGKTVAVIGLEDLIIVDHDNTLLICKKGESQKVKQVVKMLDEKNLDQFL